MLVKVVVPLLVLVLAVMSQEPLLAVELSTGNAQNKIILGAPVDVNINDPDVKKALQFAVAEYNAKSNSIYTSEVVKVISAQSQLVAGLNYFINVKMVTTSCKKANAKKKCTINSNPAIAKPRTCKLTVLSQPWLNSMQLVGNTC